MSEKLLKLYTDYGVSVVFIACLIIAIWMLWKENKTLSKKSDAQTDKVIEVVRDNTRAQTELSLAIQELGRRMRG